MTPEPGTPEPRTLKHAPKPEPDPGPVLDMALAGPPLLGQGRLICVDGPAGSGKTTFADALVAAARGRGSSASLVHLDDLYEGWGGLADVGDRLRRWVVEPLARGEDATPPRYDWAAGRYAERRTVPVSDLLVVEGVGSGHPGFADRVNVLVWVDAPPELRLRRGLERDGAALEPQWRQWLVDEQQLHAAERTQERADVVVDGVTGELRVSRRSAGAPQRRARR